MMGNDDSDIDLREEEGNFYNRNCHLIDLTSD